MVFFFCLFGVLHIFKGRPNFCTSISRGILHPLEEAGLLSNKEPFLCNCFEGGKKITFETLALSRLSLRPLPKHNAPPLAMCTWCSCCPSLALGSSRSSWQPLAARPNAESRGGAGDMSAAQVGAAPTHSLLKPGDPPQIAHTSSVVH